jgi:hypothetical protein
MIGRVQQTSLKSVDSIEQFDEDLLLLLSCSYLEAWLMKEMARLSENMLDSPWQNLEQRELHLQSNLSASVK